jgi:hypothetical protein
VRGVPGSIGLRVLQSVISCYVSKAKVGGGFAAGEGEACACPGVDKIDAARTSACIVTSVQPSQS